MLKSAPDYENLNNEERDLCEKLNILPREYLHLKLRVVREQAKNIAISLGVLQAKAV